MEKRERERERELRADGEKLHGQIQNRLVKLSNVCAHFVLQPAVAAAAAVRHLCLYVLRPGDQRREEAGAGMQSEWVGSIKVFPWNLLKGGIAGR
jgi:hypothetical protein